jgi:membrane-bound serine protease (ClpP class)
MKRGLALATAFFLLLLGRAACEDIYAIKVQGVINPPVSSFIKDSLQKAHEDKIGALLIYLDTPGGLDTSMREIVKSIMESEIPVIVYVYPSGARAASAGCIILLASHIAAMSPGTNTGAAHPVTVGKEGIDREMMKKVVRDATAYAESIANQRGRNAEFARKAVLESASVTAKEAVEKNVADVLAEDPQDLLKKIDGRRVKTKKGWVALATKGKKVTELEMPFKYRFLSYVSDPNVSYLLMMIGLYGILFEIYNPGSIFPGVIGGICIILALYSFQTIPISYAGLFLIILGLIFLILELKVVSHGILAIAGIISIVIGSIMLVNLPSSILSISWKTIVAVAVMTALFFFGILSFAVKAQLSKVRTGKEGLIGEVGRARTDISGKGKVFLHGELWNATSDEYIKEGEEVVVIDVQDLTLKVRKKGG